MRIVPANTLSRLIIDADKDWNAKDISNVDQITANTIEAPLAAESTYIVAASDSLNKKHANLVCDGTADQVEINQAISALSETVAVWDNCDDSAASWSAVQGDETLSNDNVDFAEGTGSLKCVGGAANDPGIKKVGLDSLDWSGYNLIRLYLKQDIAYTTCWLFFYDSGGNWERYDFNGRTFWHQHSISIGSHPNATSAAALNWTDIVEVRIQVDIDDDTYTFKVDDIRLVDRIGGKVVLLEGNYIIDDKIIGDANTIITGCGDGSYIFVDDGTDVGDDADGHHIIFEDCDNVVVRDLQINLNGANLGGIADKHGIGLRRVYGGILSNIYAHNLRLGGNVLDITRSDAAKAFQCRVENFDDYGIAIARCDNCNAHDNVVNGTSGNEIFGIAITGGFDGEYWSYNCSIANNRVTGTNHAIHLRKSYTCSVIGNNCYNFNYKGISVSGSLYALVSNNIIDGNDVGWVGIHTHKRIEDIDYVCTYINIIGNVIRQCKTNGANKARGIYIVDAKYSSAVGNSITRIGYTDDGAGIETLSSYAVISGNIITLAHHGILMQTLNCITGNQMYVLSGNGIDACSTGANATSITGNMLSSVTGTEIISAAGDNYCCVGNWLLGGTINLAGISNTIANNET